MQNQQLGQDESLLELEHSIGHSGKVPRSVILHPNNKDYVYIAGGCIVICDLNDPHQQYFLREHDNQVTCVAVSNSGALIASGQRGDNSDLYIWDFEYKRAKFKLSEHDYEVQTVEFSHDDKLLFSCGNQLDKKIFIWNTQNGYIVGTTALCPEPIVCMKWGGFAKDIKGRDTNKYQFCSAGNRQLFLWKFDPSNGVFEKEQIKTGTINREYMSLDFSRSNQDQIFVGTSSGDFCTFNVKSKQLSELTMVASQGVNSVQAVNPESLLVGCGDGTLALFNIFEGKISPIQKIQLNGNINSLSCNKEGNSVILGTDQGFIHKVDPQNLSQKLQSEQHTQSVSYLAYPPGVSDKFASCSDDGTIRTWDISEYVCTQRVSAQGAGSPLCVSYNEEVLLSGWQDGKIRMFQTDSGQLLWTISNAHKDGVTDILLSRNLKFICTGGEQGEVRVWEMKSRQLISHLKEHTNKVTKIQLVDNDTNIISCSRDRAVLKWDLKAEKRTNAFVQRMGGVNSFVILDDNRTLLSTGQDRKITQWDMHSQDAVGSFNTSQQGDEIQSLAISNKGHIFASGGTEQVIRLWDANSFKIIAEGRGHSGCIKSLKFSYDDRQIISSGSDGSIFVWNVFAE